MSVRKNKSAAPKYLQYKRLAEGDDDVNDLTTDNDLFAFKLSYNTGVTPLYNGNISETYWKSENDNLLRKGGTSQVVINNFVKTMKDKYGVTVTVK